MESIGQLGAGLLSGVIVLAIVIAAIAGGVRAAEKTDKALIGWLVGIGVLSLLMLVFFPAANELEKYSCRGADDFEACMNPDDS